MPKYLFNRSRQLAAAAVAAAALLLGGATAAHAQQGAITGTVVDASSLQPVAGAQVFVPNTEFGTLTDDDGTFRLTGVPAGQQTVRVRVIGYEPRSQRVTVQTGQAANVRFELSVSAVSLEEIVVTQTGAQRTRELSSAIATIDAAEAVENAAPPNFSNLLQGRTPGAIIRESAGSVGSGSTFQIRGNSSISLDNTPVLYIDGVRVNNDNANLGGMFSGAFFTGGQQTSRLNDLDPSQIESIEIIKGPSATTMYGSEAAAGVIRITTKKGGGTPQWTVRATAGGNWDETDWPIMTYNPTEDPLVQLGFAKDTLYMMNLLEDGLHPGIDPPWRTGFEQVYEATTTGGFSEGNVSYFASGKFEKRDGNLPGNFTRRVNARGNASFQAENVSISFNNGFTGNTTLLPQNDNNGDGYLGNTLLGLAFWTPINAVDPNAGGSPVKSCPLALELSRAFGIPLEAATDDFCDEPFLARTFEQLALEDVFEEVQRYTGSVNITYEPWSFLTTRLTAGYDETARENRTIVPVRPELVSLDDEFAGTIEKSNSTIQTLTLQGNATAAFQLTDDIATETSAGVQFYEDQTDGVFGLGEEFPAGSPTIGNSVINQASDFFSEKRTVGIFAEEQLAWKDRLFLTGGVRLDENSAFGENLGMSAFPRFGLSYVLSDEEWFPGLFEQFKVRGAWGQSGKQPNTNDALALLGSVSVPFRGSELLGVTPNRPGNPTLKPERDEEIEVGADFSLAEGRLSGTFTWYRQLTNDAIVNRPLAPSLGFPGSQVTNIGRMTNKGIEASLNATAFSRPDLEWDWTVQMSTNYNRIDSLASPIDAGFSQFHKEGFPFGGYWAFKILEEGGELVPSDTAVYTGLQPTPHVNGSVSTTMTLFGHVTLYALADIATGHGLGDNTESFGCWFLATCAQVWDTNPDGSLTKQARIIKKQSQLRFDGNSVKPADYVKLRTASLRIRIPRSVARLFRADRASVSIIGQNLGKWTPYTGVDPEMNGAGQQSNAFRADFLTLPPARRVTAELSVSF